MTYRPVVPSSLRARRSADGSRSRGVPLLRRLLLPLLAALAGGGFATPARATILVFDQIRLSSGDLAPTISGNAVPQDYGDRASGLSVGAPGGAFTYGEAGEGFTPNVIVDYFTTVNAPGVSLWQDSYGDLTNVLFGNQNSVSLNVQLTADPGFLVELYDFDLGGWPMADYAIAGVRVLSGATDLFSLSDVVVEGDLAGPPHASFDFMSPLIGQQLLIQVDYSNLSGSQQDNIGIDNIRFGQDLPPPDPEPVPEPSTFWLFGAALAAAVALRRRR